MNRQLNILNIISILVAMLFFNYGFWQLSYLTNIDIANTVVTKNSIATPQFSAVEITRYAVVIMYSQLAGFLTAAILAFVLSPRKRIDLFETLTSVLIFWFLSWLGVTHWKYFAMLSRLAGSGFNNYWFFAVNGVLLTLVGLIILLRKKRLQASFDDLLAKQKI